MGLARRFGTPIIIFDRATFEQRARAYAASASPENVFYAGKAFLCVAVCELLDELGLGLDVCSGGELTTAIRAGFPGERIIFHGNNKSVEEIELARSAGVGRIVADSLEELDRIAEAQVQTRLLLRVTPGVEAHTHEFVQTGQEDSKFGFPLAEGIALDALKRAMDVPGSQVVGIHAHIGSQIFELAAFELGARKLADFLKEANEKLGFVATEVNMGGGLGIAHTQDEMTPSPTTAVDLIRATVEREMSERDMHIPAVCYEPGRSISGSAGATIYSVGTVKKIPGVRTYVSVDGGMSDNIRPALYGARYDAFLCNRMNATTGPRMTVAGKHCESGDVLIKEVHLPEDVTSGDLLCIPATGAYTYSMASNYNRVPRPPVVMVHEGKATELVARETYDDLIRLDRHIDGKTT